MFRHSRRVLCAATAATAASTGLTNGGSGSSTVGNSTTTNNNSNNNNSSNSNSDSGAARAYPYGRPLLPLQVSRRPQLERFLSHDAYGMHYDTLSNGCRVACEYIPRCPFTTIGVWIDAGSRFERPANSGTAHFLEHMNFKGTERYSTKQVEDFFEFTGSHFNAYTSRDRTAYYIKCFNPHADTLMGVVADLLLSRRSASGAGRYSDRREFHLERSTILAEMREVEEQVEEVIMDNIHAAAYDVRGGGGNNGGCGLPLTILGPVENISRNINREMLLDYIDTHYTGPRFTVVSSGGLAPEAVKQIAEKHFGAAGAANHRPPLRARYQGGTSVMYNEDMAATYTAFCFPMCGAAGDDALALQLVHNIIGAYRDDCGALHRRQHDLPTWDWDGSGAHADALSDNNNNNSSVGGGRCANLVSLRPFYTPYEETGLLGYQIVTSKNLQPVGTTVSGAADPSSDDNNNINNNNNNDTSHRTQYRDDSQTYLLDTLLRRFESLAETRVSEGRLALAKAEFLTSLTLVRDSTTNSAEDIGRQMIHHGRRVPLAEVHAAVDAITPERLRDAVQRCVGGARPTVACIGDSRALPDLSRVRGWP